ncbi:MAG: OmpH family outer membrane protein [Flavobacteriaceae bacterium]
MFVDLNSLKKSLLQLALLGLIGWSNTSLHAQRGVRIAYLDMDRILVELSEYQKASQLLDERIVKWKEEIELKKLQAQQLREQLGAEKVLLTPELIKDREVEIKEFEREIIQLQERRFGPQGDLIKQRVQLIQPIQDQVMTIVQKIATDKKYDFVFDRSNSPNMLFSSKNYDISKLIIQQLQRQEKIKKRQEKIEAVKSKLNR